ncbi:MAG: hypothetical protein HYS18_13615 [Burkholderiales bacterium]|nr:hypothetical protein [Burkholderiales bacterium]
MKKIFPSLGKVLPALCIAGMASLTWAQAIVSGGILTNQGGMTLYTFDRDTPNAGTSACAGDCAALWPPLLAQTGDKAKGDYSIIVRDDGKRQWAYKGKPLYTWSKDQKPGDKTGDGVNKVWHVAMP